MVQTFEDVKSIATALGWDCQLCVADEPGYFGVDFYRKSPADIGVYFAYDVKSPEDIPSELRSEVSFEFDPEKYVAEACSRTVYPLTRAEAAADAEAVKTMLCELADYLEGWRGD